MSFLYHIVILMLMTPKHSLMIPKIRPLNIVDSLKKNKMWRCQHVWLRVHFLAPLRGME